MSQNLAVYGAVFLLGAATLWACLSSLARLQRNYAATVAQLAQEREVMRRRHAMEDEKLRTQVEHLREVLRHCTCASSKSDATSHATSGAKGRR